MAEKIKFFHLNKWLLGTLTYSTQHENFPAANTQNRDFGRMWNSQHGAGSGWGRFVIKSGVNDRLDFKDSTSTVRAASLTPATYNAASIFAHLKTQMEAVCSDTFTWAYLESGTDKNKFKVTIGSGTFELLTNTGANKARSVFPTIGFSDAADKTGASSYTADYVRIHTEEFLVEDFGSAIDIYGVFIKGHNFSSTAVVKVEFSTNNFSSISESFTFTIQAGVLVLEWDAAKTYRYIRIYIQDIDNPAGYVAMGVVSAAPQLQPSENFLNEGEIDRIDPSELQVSAHGQESSIQIEHYDVWPYTFLVKGSTEKANFDALFDNVGYSKAFFIVEDPASPLTTTKYVAISSFKWTPRVRARNLWYLSMSIREQR